MPCIDFSLSERQGKTFCRRCAGQGARRWWEMCGGQAPEHQGTAPSDRVSISTRVKHIGSRPVINRISSGAMWNHSKKEEQENRRKKKKKKGCRGRPGAARGRSPASCRQGATAAATPPGRAGAMSRPPAPPGNAKSQKKSPQNGQPPAAELPRRSPHWHGHPVTPHGAGSGLGGAAFAKRLRNARFLPGIKPQKV